MIRRCTTRRDGTAIGELIGEGIPLGIDPNWHYGDVGRGRLEPGEFIFIGTDGIWDTTDPSGIQFGQAAAQESPRRQR